MGNRIETAELSDAELDNVSGGVGASLPGGLASVDVTPDESGVSASVSGGVPGVGGVSGGLSAGLGGVEGGLTLG
ncbi:type A2 lantipeptide [Streptomyces albidus (ex Kaewkla and Franco 2022)]|jgi:hypothetical protein|uniref:type A2 lantipeptide n=1 Tax=Streptomyces albidus (ex Kaewkla and Franco 2022) TaxID=722709 RepID=UPI0015EEE8DF|nr:type A2 lantipeptide [Streptomyces albidus (ex Kaewkla and Franco 2022)]